MESPFASPKTPSDAASRKQGSPEQAIACFWSSIVSTLLCFLCLIIFWIAMDGPYYLRPEPWYITALGWLVPLLAATTQVIGVIYWRSVWHMLSEFRWLEVGLWVSAAMVVSAIPLAFCLFGLTMTLIGNYSPSPGPVITAG